MNIEKINYRGWQNCVRLYNQQVDLIVTTDVGPRIIRYGFIDQPNELKEFEDQLGLVGGDDWHIFGGHRLWHAPEAVPRTYLPDNTPVQAEFHSDILYIIQPVEQSTGIQKEMDIQLPDDSSQVTIVHRLRNLGLWPVRLAVWGLTVMATGGVTILPLPPRGTHPEDLLPGNHLVLWPYTDMADPRWTWSTRFIMMRQDEKFSIPQKIGASIPDGWIAYARHGHCFIKLATYQPTATYPDNGCNFEAFNFAHMAEVESLSPLQLLQPGEKIEHTENWFLIDHIPQPNQEKDIINQIVPLLSHLPGRN